MSGQPEASSVDVLPWWSVPIILAAIGATILLGRTHPHVAPAAIALAWALTCEIADRWQGRRRMTAGAIAAIALLYAFAITIQVHGRAILGWVLGGALMAVWTAWRIGGGAGTRTREVAKIQSSLPKILEANSPRFKDGTPVAKIDTRKIKADKFGNILIPYFAKPDGFDGPAFARDVASDLHVPGHMVRDLDLSNTVAQGKHIMTVRAFASFAMTAPAMPDPKDWPKGKIPLGWDANSEVVWLPMLDSDAQHMLIGGTTGAGKSNFIRFLILTFRAIDWSVWACDGSGGSLGMGPYCDLYHETDDEGVLLLDRAWKEMKRREGEIKAGGMYDGPGILVVIDESASVLSSKAAALAAKEISARGRKARMAIVLGLQSAYVDAAGGGQTLANLPTRIAFRTVKTKGDIQSGLILGASIPEGMSPSLIRREDRGECLVRGMPHEDWMKMRTWEVIDLSGGGTAPPHLHPPEGPVEQAERDGGAGAGAGAGAPPAPDPSEADTRPAKDRIRDLLSDLPRSASWFGGTAGCTRQVADRHLKSLAAEGVALQDGTSGWRRRKANERTS